MWYLITLIIGIIIGIGIIALFSVNKIDSENENFTKEKESIIKDIKQKDTVLKKLRKKAEDVENDKKKYSHTDLICDIKQSISL